MNTKLPKYVSWHAEPYSWQVDAFSISWKGAYIYAFLPFSLVGSVYQKIQQERCPAVLVIADWPGQPFFATIMNATNRKIKFRPHKDNLLSRGNPKNDLSKIGLIACRFF